MGYEDLNDDEVLRGDSLLSPLMGKTDLTGNHRVRGRDCGYALASASTLNRMELGEPEDAAHDRYNRRWPSKIRQRGDRPREVQHRS